MRIDTGFHRHVGYLVDKEGDEPPAGVMADARRSLGDGATVKWIDVTSHGSKRNGVQKNWWWVMGIDHA